jgi:hypothetical protein
MSVTQTFACQCGSLAHQIEYDPKRGRVRKCLECGLVTLPDRQIAEVPQPDDDDSAAAIQLEFDDVVFVGAKPKRKPVPQRHSAAVARRVSDKPLNVISLARKRLRELNTEIKRLQKLEQERDKLEHLLRAADGKPVAVVANLRTAKGA